MLASLGGAAGLVFLLVYLAIAIAGIVACVKILNKAGYSGWWVLIGFVPIANIVMFFVFAFSEWPALRRNAAIPDPTWPAPPSSSV